MSNAGNGVAVGGTISRYLPFGDWRTEPTAGLTDRGYTGHKHNNLGGGANDLGLIYMNARYYVPSLARFASADTIVPNPASPQSFNRFSYVLNSPLNYTDPTGHCGSNPNSGDEYENDSACWDAYYDATDILGSGYEFLSGWDITDLQDLLFWLGSGVNFTKGKDGETWSSSDLRLVIGALNKVRDKIGDWNKTRQALGLDRTGGLTFTMCPSCDPSDNNHDYNSETNLIRLDDTQPITEFEVLHEIGHAVDWNMGSGNWWSNDGFTGTGLGYEYQSQCSLWCRITGGTPTYNVVKTSGYFPPLEASYNASRQEDFADTFAAWVLGITPSHFDNPVKRERIDVLDSLLKP